MKLGTHYYPEQCPRDHWERDFENMAQMGLKVVQVGQSAWDALEPAEGQMSLEWLEQCVDLATLHRLEVILCTPTATPPLWLIQQHPHILHTSNRQHCFGTEIGINPLAPAMVEAAKRIVTALADRFGNHPAVIGWQIDDRFTGDFDQSDLSRQVFQTWLEERYQSIEALNAAWGGTTCRVCYRDFSQICMPRSVDCATDNPHQRLDASRFWSWAMAQFSKVQVDLLKPHIGKRFIVANFQPLQTPWNPEDLAGELAMFGWNMRWPIWTRPSTDPGYRTGDPADIALLHSQMASYTGRWSVLGLSPGGAHRTDPFTLAYPGAIRLWLWNAWAHGAEFATALHYRQPLQGSNVFQHGLTGTDGTTASAGGREFAQFASELASLDPEKLLDVAHGRQTRRPKAVTSANLPTPSVGMLIDFEQLWGYAALPCPEQWDYFRLLSHLYGAVARLGLKPQIIRPGQSVPRYLKLLIVPSVQMVDDSMLQSWRDHLSAGGSLLMTCRTALTDKMGRFFDGPLAAPILDLIGGSVEAYDHLPEGQSGLVELDDRSHPWHAWGELLYDEEQTRVLARYADQFYEGAAAILQKKHAKNATVTYCGVFPEAELADALLESLATQLDLPIRPTPRQVQLLRRGRYNLCLNFQDTRFEVPAPPDAEFIVGSAVLEPAEVAVWEEK